MKTYLANAQNVERKWYIVDAEGKTLGHLASKVAAVLRGKHKPTYTPHVDTGDYVVVINAEKILVTGSKETQKVYKHHTGYPGGLREIPLNELRDKYPERIIEKAVKGMLPKNSLGKKMFKKLKVYAGPEHKQGAHELEELDI